MGWGLNLYELVRIPVRKPCEGYYLRWYYNGWHYWFFQPGRYGIVTEGEKYRTLSVRKILIGTGVVSRSEAMAIKTILNTREVYLLTIAGWMNIRIEPGSVMVYDHSVEGIEIELTAYIGSKEISYDNGYTPVPYIPITSSTITYCEIIIGTQVWMCYNWYANYPGSKVYNDDEVNLSLYGGLYTFNQVKSPGFAPTGWHMPTLIEWEELFDFLGGFTIAGGHLKSAGLTYWITPNTGADNSSGFDVRGAGFFINSFMGLNEVANFWTADEYSADRGKFVQLTYHSASAIASNIPKGYFLSVRLIKDTTAPPVIYDDWFLPSLDTIVEMYGNLHVFGVGSFAASQYWTSSEDNATRAYWKSFNDGTFGFALKTASYHVRACRSFTAGVGAYSLRDIGPAGGLIFYIDGAGTTYYEAAPSDQSAGNTWSNITAVAVTGTGTVIGTGQANTLLIIGQVGHTDSAAKLCNDLEV